MAKYHLNGNGDPGVCSATQGRCPYGGDASHYDNPEDARAAYEMLMEPFARRNGPVEKAGVGAMVQIENKLYTVVAYPGYHDPLDSAGAPYSSYQLRPLGGRDAVVMTNEQADTARFLDEQEMREALEPRRRANALKAARAEREKEKLSPEEMAETKTQVQALESQLKEMIPGRFIRSDDILALELHQRVEDIIGFTNWSDEGQVRDAANALRELHSRADSIAEILRMQDFRTGKNARPALARMVQSINPKIKPEED
jgi:hypothetical protein